MQMAMKELLNVLREFDAVRDKKVDGKKDRVSTGFIESIPPRYSEESLSEELKEALASLGITKLYEHQMEAVRNIVRGKNIVIVSPTASGKTLSFNIPILASTRSNRRAKALMVYPTKALANDQRAQLERLSRAFKYNYPDSWMYDGDVPEEHRKALRQSPPPILLTNPEYLHLSFLGHWNKWQHFLKDLKFVVIDEIHEYRGFFGTNAALLFRRFLYKLKQLGVSPRIVLSSATCANPLEHAFRLTGLDFSLITDASNMRPERHLLFVDPDIPSYRFSEIFMLRVVRAALACLKMNLSSIVFCPTRKFVEEAAGYAKNEARKLNLDAECIVPYRSGYTPDERRSIEDGLRTGKYKIVFSTNALEIGIDIGKLDVSILAGFPDNVMSAWQRIGRAGRFWNKKAYVIYFAQNNPVDQFYAANINSFLERPLDEIVVGIDNEELIQRHLPCLLHENGPVKSQTDWQARQLGKAFWAAYKKGSKNYHPIPGPGPHVKVPIRSVGGSIWKLTYNSKEIGTISDQQAFREAYIGAIYNHYGQSYRVSAQGAGEVFLIPAQQGCRTEPSFYSVPTIDEVQKGERWGDELAVYYGVLTIFDNLAGYKLLDQDGNVLEESREQSTRRIQVRSFWISLESNSSSLYSGRIQGFKGLEQLMRIGAPFVIPCDRHDLNGLSSTKQITAAFLHETVPGGIGLAEKLLSVWRAVVNQGIQIA
ncbi:MAG: DEAD/DEAH box helicase, partial [Candidatus Hydrogenedentes bacterium]|nr:DEAD/DEAH box helicase [Candidatus Hydrogenedentota bacterium]